MRNKDIEKYISRLFKDVDLGRTEVITNTSLTPDSGITILKGGYGTGLIFALYDEDAVFSIEEITYNIESSSGKKVKRYFTPKELHPEPNEYYTVRPEGWDDIAEYAALDGIQYVFFAELE